MVEVTQDFMYELFKKLDRLDRIENRLELRELAKAQARFESHP